MSLIHLDGFDPYSSSLEFFQSSAGPVPISTASPRNGRGAILFTGGYTGYKSMDGNRAEFVWGMAVRIDTLPGSTQLTVRFRQGGNLQIELRLSAAGILSVTRNGTTLGTATMGGLVAGVWNYWELKAKIHGSTGTIELRINEVAVLTLTGQNTSNTGSAYCDDWGIDTVSGLTIDDYYLLDTGGSQCNDFLGDIRCQTLYPSAAGDTTDFTPSAGSNYAAVDETPQNGDTDYVQSSTVNHVDTYNYGNLSGTVASVKAVVVKAMAKKDDAGSRSFALVARPGTTDRVGSDKAPGTSYAYHQEIWELNPDTSAAWSGAEVDAAKFGLKVTV